MQIVPYEVWVGLTGLVLAGCVLTGLWMRRKRWHRRRRLSALLAREGWDTAPEAEDADWHWQGDWGRNRPSIVVLRPAAQVLELRVTSAVPLLEGGRWLVLPRSMCTPDTRAWPAAVAQLLQCPFLTCPALPDHVLYSEGGAAPTPRVWQTLQRLGRDPRVRWAVYLDPHEGWARRIGARADASWPEMRQLGRALIP